MDTHNELVNPIAFLNSEERLKNCKVILKKNYERNPEECVLRLQRGAYDTILFGDQLEIIESRVRICDRGERNSDGLITPITFVNSEDLYNEGILQVNKMKRENPHGFVKALMSGMVDVNFLNNYEIENTENNSEVPEFKFLDSNIAAIPVEPQKTNGMLVPVESKQAKSQEKTLCFEDRDTAYSISKELAKKINFAMHNEGLYFYNGRCYELLTRESAFRLIVKNCRFVVEKFGNGSIVKDIYQLLCMEPSILVKSEHFDISYLPFANGVYHIPSGRFYPPSPSYFYTSYINCNFEQKSNLRCDHFDNFVATIANNNSRLSQIIWEIIGYYLTFDMNAKIFAVFQGCKNSGKSKLGEFIASFYNSEAVTSMDIDTMNDKFALSDLVGKRINISLDLPAGKFKSSAVSKVKQLTGGDFLSSDVKYMSRIKFYNTCKLLFATNHALELYEYDEAFFSRAVVVPFNVSIPKEEWNFRILDTFENEKFAIVMKALNFYKGLVAKNYIFSGDSTCNENVKKSKNQEMEFESPNETISEFVNSRCEFVALEQGTFTRILYSDYENFCYTNGYDCLEIVPFSQAFSKRYGDLVRHDKWRDRTISKNPENGIRGIVLKGVN